ncbi:MAG: hypothetical protein V1495_06510 [Pseudomonadota bacterium]
MVWMLAAACVACTEAPLIVPGGQARLNNPVSMAFVGNNLAVVASANVGLTQVAGSLMPVDLANRKLLPDTAIPIPNFAGKMAVDTDPSRPRIYIADRGDDAILVYSYSIPGTSTAISFSAVDAPTPQNRGPSGTIANAIMADSNPFDVTFVPGTPSGDLLIATNNLSGSVTVVPAATLAPIDLNPEDGLLNGLILFSAANFRIKESRPGLGANELVPTADGTLYFITSTRTSDIYVFDPKDLKVEGMVDLSAIAASPGTRGMAVAQNGLAYIVQRALNAVVVLDVAGIRDDGNDYKVIDPKVVDLILVGKDPEGVALSKDETKIFVSNEGDNSVSVIDTTTRALLRKIAIPGSAPSRLVREPTRDANGVLYVLNFLSNNITLLDLTTGDLLGTIE